MLLPVMASGAQAQSNLELEVRGDVNLPTGDFSEPTGLDADAKLGFGALLFLPVRSRISLYGGGGQEYFDCEDCPGDDDEVITSGFEAGVKIPLPAEDTPLHPWVRAGLVYYTVDVTRGGLEAESDWNLGFQAAAGLEFPVGERFSIAPGIRYQTFSAELDDPGIDVPSLESDVSYFSFDLGLRFKLKSME